MSLPKRCIMDNCDNIPNERDGFVCDECLKKERKRKADVVKRKKSRQRRKI